MTGLCDHHCHLLLGLYDPHELVSRFYCAGVRSHDDWWQYLNEQVEAQADRLAAGGQLEARLDSFVSSEVEHFVLQSVCAFDALLCASVLRRAGLADSGRFSLGVGIHPFWLSDVLEHNAWEAELQLLLKVIAFVQDSCPKLYGRALGEVGLDTRCTVDMDEQYRCLSDFLHATVHLNLPYSFHCVRAFTDLQRCIRQTDLKGRIRGCFHGFNGKPPLARALIKDGLKTGLGQALLFADNQNKFTRLAHDLPADQILLESDFDGTFSDHYDGTLIPRISAHLEQLRQAPLGK